LISENRRSFALAEFVKRPQADIKLARPRDYPLGAASVNRPAFAVLGPALNTWQVPLAQRADLPAQYATATGPPCVDPIIDRIGAIINRVESESCV
jgi:hypothetical protein